MHLAAGSPADALTELAGKVDADLIVVGSKGMQGSRRLLGSIPNSVAHGATCNVSLPKRLAAARRPTNGVPAVDDHYDLVVVGAGPAGEKAAAQAAYFDKRVAVVVERAPELGGELPAASVPTKAMREAALYLTGFRGARRCTARAWTSTPSPLSTGFGPGPPM